MDHVAGEEQLASVFARPSPEALRELSARDFERFVGYVFTRAGYIVEDTSHQYGLGIDLKLYAPKTGKAQIGHGARPVAYVQVKRLQPQSLVGSPTVLGFMGSLALGRVPGYLITTSDFTRPAYRLAARNQQTHLMNGDTLLRYITYLRGSRYEGSLAEPLAPDHLLATNAREQAQGRTARTLVVANNKGGVGKTTTALQLGAALAQHEQRVLLVDMDAQANLTTLIRRVPGVNIPAPHLAAFFAGQAELAALVQSTAQDRLSLIPAHPSLRLLDTGGSAQPATELRFVADLYSEAIGQAFDWVIMDTPPAMTLNTRVALAAADTVLVPAVADGVSYDGLNNLFDTIDTMHGLTGGATVLGGLLTRWEERNVPMRLALPGFMGYFQAKGTRLLETRIPEDRSIIRAQVDQGDIFASIARGGSAVTAYQALAEEVLTYGNDI